MGFKIPFRLSSKHLINYDDLWCFDRTPLGVFFHAVKVSNVSVTLSVMSTGAFITALIEPLVYKRSFDFYEIILGF